MAIATACSVVAVTNSLRILRERAPDVVLSSAFGAPFGFQELFPEDWAGYVNRALERLPRWRENRSAAPDALKNTADSRLAAVRMCPLAEGVPVRPVR